VPQINSGAPAPPPRCASASYLCRSVLLVVDEIGYLPITSDGGNLFFELVKARAPAQSDPDRT
jgi:DNA replication protein DnaC